MVRTEKAIFFFTNCYFCHSVHCNVLFFLSIFLFSSSKLSFYHIHFLGKQSLALFDLTFLSLFFEIQSG